MLSIQVPKSELAGEDGEETEIQGEVVTPEEQEGDDQTKTHGGLDIRADAELVEEDVVFSWKHFVLLNIAVLSSFYVIFLWIKGVFYGFGSLKVCETKIIDHPCRFLDRQIGLLADEAMAHRMQKYVGTDAIASEALVNGWLGKLNKKGNPFNAKDWRDRL